MNNKFMCRIILLICFFAVSTLTYAQNTADIESNLSEKEQKISSLILRAKKESIENPEKARQTYLEALEIDKNCDACYYNISNLYAGANMLDKAYSMAKKAYEMDSTNHWYIINYAKLAFGNKDYNNSTELYLKLLENNPNKREAWLSVALSYDEIAEYDKAIAILDSIKNKFGQSNEISYLKHNAYLKQGDWSNAIKEAEILLDDNSGDIRFLTLLADAHSNNNTKDEALNYYNKAISIDPNFYPALVGKAETYRKSGDFNPYFATLNNLFANKKIESTDKAEYLRLILEIPSFSRHFNKNIDTLFAIGASVHPVSSELKYIQAMHFSQTNRINESISLLRTNISINEKDESSWYMLIMILSNLQRWEDLNTMTEKAINIFPNNYLFYQNRAVALSQMGDVKTGITVLNKALKLEMNNTVRSSIKGLLGDLHSENKSYKNAYKEYENALKYNPDNAMVLNNYAYSLSSNNKKLDVAYKMSEKSLKLDANNSSFLDTFAYILYLQKKYSEAKVIFRQAISAGGNKNSIVLEHYADTLFKLGEYRTAGVYWSQALDKEDCTNKKEIEKKIKNLEKLNY